MDIEKFVDERMCDIAQRTTVCRIVEAAIAQDREERDIKCTYCGYKTVITLEGDKEPTGDTTEARLMRLAEKVFDIRENEQRWKWEKGKLLIQSTRFIGAIPVSLPAALDAAEKEVEG